MLKEFVPKGYYTSEICHRVVTHKPTLADGLVVPELAMKQTGAHATARLRATKTSKKCQKIQ